MAIHIKNLKVRPKKSSSYTPCSAQFAAILGCWATTGDFHSVKQCQEAAQTLFHCMRTTPMAKKNQRPAINYHLARLGKNIQ
ncbi:37s ribosomal protein mitochondrial [Moniliophthora roreri MCA 2997]|uniref:37s ribosomal protein mitochondrial n=1 Tax=Moniliophthora roreri (strain MCA 2997) TaxID=1381753 RepID=V2YMR6_MONRO|nr:37s ribosomal protein mitochondrial [Moniliophthora roreri MCA 2997]